MFRPTVETASPLPIGSDIEAELRGNHASGIALITTYVNLGGFAGPYAIGFIRQRTESLTGAFAVAGLLLFVFAAVVLLLPKESQNVPREFQ